MNNYQLGQKVFAALGNFGFGGTIIMKVTSFNFFTKIEQVEYTIDLPISKYVPILLYIKTDTIREISNI